MEKEIIQEKSEILFLYETSYNIPNGDPFTGEQRYDEETKKILVSDVRIKRFARTYFEDCGKLIYVSSKDGRTDAKKRLEFLVKNQECDVKKTDIGEIMKSCLDVRLFGGISTLGDDAKDIKIKVKETDADGNSEERETICSNGHVQFTGPVQFAFLNPSLNRVVMRMHQNTSHFSSNDKNAQGTIGTTTIVPYSVVQIHGWINPKVAIHTGMTDDDKKLLFKGLWYGTGGEGSSFSRSKIGQNSLLLLEIVYAGNSQKLYGIERLISIKPKDGKNDEQLRSMDDFDFDFSKIQDIASSDKVKEIRYYTEVKEVEDKLKESSVKVKLKKIAL